MKYLFMLKEHQCVRECFKELTDKYNYRLTEESKGVGGVNYSIVISANRGDYSFFMYEFPSNCSAIIIGGVQDLFTINAIRGVEQKEIKEILSFAEDFSKQFLYRGIIVTTTNSGLVTLLQENGFEVMCKLDNAHSGRDNTFMLKTVKLEV